MDYTLTLVGLGCLILVLLAFAVGRSMDAIYRISWKRRFMKTDEGILYVFSKDRRSIPRKVIVNFSNDRVVMPKRFGRAGETVLWVIDKNDIWREDEPQSKTSLEFTYQEGVPCAFVSYDSLQNIKFNMQDSDARPDEVGAILQGWFSNMTAKIIASKPKKDLVLLVVIGALLLSAVAAFLSYQSSQTINDVKAMVAADHAVLSNASVSVKQVITVTPTPVGGG